MRPVWVGSSAARISRLDGDRAEKVGAASAPTFLAEHPERARLYAVEERNPGSIAAFAIGTDGELTRTGVVSSGGSGPCHLQVHPEGGWLYAANYGDGLAAAIALDEAGDLTDERVDLPHTGSGPNAARQEGPHAHSSWVSPGGGWLVVADLGTDELRAYPLVDGRPGPVATTTPMPPGSGPRHAAVHGDRVHVACELSCDIVTLAFDETSGTGEVLGSVHAVTLPVRSGAAHSLSHIELLGDATLVIGVRGADSLAVVGLTDGVVSSLRAEVLTVAWPRHLTVVDGTVLVAGERADAIGMHAISGDAVGHLEGTIETPAPMCLLPAR